MRKIFVSYKFRDPDRTYASYIKDLIQSHSLEVDTGEDLGGEPLWDEIKSRIEACDGLVALFLSPDDASRHRWPLRELDHASSGKKRVYAMVDTTFPWNDPENREHGGLDLNSPLPAFTKLSRIIGRWRRDAGRRIAVRVLPDNVARLAAKDGALYSCQYRLFKESEPAGTWQTVKPAPLDSGYVFMANGVGDDLRIQVQVTGNGVPTYSSVAAPQLITIDLKEDNG